MATNVNQNVKNTEVQKIISPSLSKLGINVLLAMYNSNMFNGKLITNAIAVSPTDSFKDCVSILTLHQIQCKFLV